MESTVKKKGFSFSRITFTIIEIFSLLLLILLEVNGRWNPYRNFFSSIAFINFTWSLTEDTNRFDFFLIVYLWVLKFLRYFKAADTRSDFFPSNCIQEYYCTLYIEISILLFIFFFSFIFYQFYLKLTVDTRSNFFSLELHSRILLNIIYRNFFLFSLFSIFYFINFSWS